MFRRWPFIFIVVSLSASCSTKPEAIRFGEDQCHFCKMTIIDKQFGAELVTKKGKIYKFDDVKCLLDYYYSGHDSPDIYEHKLVVDFAGQGNLIEANTALFVTSPEIRSPMNGNVAAFQSKPSMNEANKQWNGNHLSWDELSTRTRQ
jgi:copper chaperone NosL